MKLRLVYDTLVPGICSLDLILVPRPRFGDKLLIIRVCCPHLWECGSKRVTWGPALQGTAPKWDPHYYCCIGMYSGASCVCKNKSDTAV